MNIREELFCLKDEKYKEFSEKLTKTKYPLIGVRMPTLKRIAKKINKEDLLFSGDCYFEEIMIEGLKIGYLTDIVEIIEKLKNFVCKIDDWSVCDSCCANLKIVNKRKKEMWNFITKFKNSDKEFEVRFMVVMMMQYYLCDEYIDEVFEIIDNNRCGLYYANMAISWLICESLVKCEEKTINYLNECNLNDFVFNKAISKACESYRVSNELKGVLRKMKR